VEIQRGDLARNNLVLQTITLKTHAERLAWLAQRLPSIEGTGIVYVLTIADAEQVSQWLKLKGLDARAYHSRLMGEVKIHLEQALLRNELKVLVATSALGMGFDKPDLSFVFHYQMPGSVIAYYQQVGRAGRAVSQAYGVMLGGDGDNKILEYFKSTAFPRRETVEALLSALGDSNEGMSEEELESRVNLSRKSIGHALELISLEIPAPVTLLDDRWRRTPTALLEAFWERAERVTAARSREQEQMQEYLALRGGHLAFLVKALDGDIQSVRESHYAQLSAEVEPSVVRDAEKFLRRNSIPIFPRVRIPGGGVAGLHPGSTIPNEWRISEGRALAYWGDAGWGNLIHLGKYEAGEFHKDLVEATASMIREWGPEPAPTWITAVPSHRHPTLVANFARALAQTLNIEYCDAVTIKSKREQQKLQENSFHQASNAAEAFAVREDMVMSGPCLLVDDIVNSRWTFTVIGKMLRTAGSGVVRPVALAMTSGGSDD
jgi:ATP-dependent DNA helicase RecQ